MGGATFIGAAENEQDAKVVLYGAPYDSTTSFRPGTRFGPAAIRSESFGIETYSPLQDRDLEDFPFFDSGDLELPFGAPDRALEMIEARAEEILSAGKIPFLLGGEHLVTLGAVRAVVRRHPDLRIIHFDAHADLREDYLGVRLSHACVMRRCHDLLGDGRIFQFGIRSGTREEFAFMRDGHVVTESFSDGTLQMVIDSIPPDAPVYLTVDMDVLDPSIFPGTGTPVAGGFDYRELVDDMVRIGGQLNVVGLDNVELAPSLDPTGRSTALACTFLRECLLALTWK
ncbi:MAG: agmatinase [Kiritimatiellae bacterium]|nr:agmatinase [Kiritimatiellia bacterium]